MPEPLSLGQLGRVLSRHWLLITLGIVVGGLLAFGVTRLMTPVYASTTTQLVKGQPGTGAAANYEAAQYAVSRAKSYPPFIYSSTVLEGVRSDLGNASTITELREDVSAINPPSTPLLEITATGATPEEARDKANSAARHTAQFITDIETVGSKSPVTVELAVDAALPTRAQSPQTLVITALGAMVGFGLALVLALILTYARYQRRSDLRREAALSWLDDEARPPSVDSAEARPPASNSAPADAQVPPPVVAHAASTSHAGAAADVPPTSTDRGSGEPAVTPGAATGPASPTHGPRPPVPVGRDAIENEAAVEHLDAAPQDITATKREDDDADTEVMPRLPVDGAERVKPAADSSVTNGESVDEPDELEQPVAR